MSQPKMTPEQLTRWRKSVVKADVLNHWWQVTLAGAKDREMVTVIDCLLADYERLIADLSELEKRWREYSQSPVTVGNAVEKAYNMTLRIVMRDCADELAALLRGE